MMWLIIHLFELVINFLGIYAYVCTSTLDNQ